MSGGAPSEEPTFAVGAGHLGRTEREWAASGPLHRLKALTVPDRHHAVVVAPHPDDEVLGAGGLLQLLAERHVAVDVCAVTDGEASWGPLDDRDADDLRRVRTAESEEAIGRLGLDPAQRFRLGVADGRVAEEEDALADWLAARVTPQSLVLAPWTGDGHPDHDAAGDVARRVAAAAGAPCVHYLVWVWHWADPAGTEVPWASCRRLVLSRRQTARKRWATASFRSQTRVPTPTAGGLPVLPPPILRRFWRTWEIFVE
ncbi:MAG: PIG-L family deacetylase [Actinomycetota bacterium]|nr:PIG-L family deacetylase [Actinomycetota bacterium]